MFSDPPRGDIVADPSKPKKFWDGYVDDAFDGVCYFFGMPLFMAFLILVCGALFPFWLSIKILRLLKKKRA